MKGLLGGTGLVHHCIARGYRFVGDIEVSVEQCGFVSLVEERFE